MTSNRQIRASRGAGFTLVEMLVVIVIIGMLAGLTTTVLVSARRSVRNSVVASEEAQLSIALDQYKNKYGEYPPDLSDSDAVTRHIKKRWPRYNVDYNTFVDHVALGCQLSSGNYSGTIATVDELNGQHVWRLGPYISSLVFWLGGLPNSDGIPSGFYANPKAPLGIARVNGVDKPIHKPNRATREKPLYSFDRRSLSSFYVDNTQGVPVYCPGVEADGAYIPAVCEGGYPIMYFRPTIGSGYAGKFVLVGETPTDNVSQAVPYARVLPSPGTPGSWYEERRFQLVHPGADGLFGPLFVGTDPNSGRATDADGVLLPVGIQPTVNVTLADDDNITNFLQEGTLQSEYRDANGN